MKRIAFVPVILTLIMALLSSCAPSSTELAGNRLTFKTQGEMINFLCGTWKTETTQTNAGEFYDYLIFDEDGNGVHGFHNPALTEDSIFPLYPTLDPWEGTIRTSETTVYIAQSDPVSLLYHLYDEAGNLKQTELYYQVPLD
ncbi:MAG: hypothetical protein J6Z79_06760 [Clostridia bacterium]|nr:hypothetical protein [Clostridia bacterium]